MRHVFHEILARYLESDQHAFEADLPRTLAGTPGLVAPSGDRTDRQPSARTFAAPAGRS